MGEKKDFQLFAFCRHNKKSWAIKKEQAEPWYRRPTSPKLAKQQQLESYCLQFSLHDFEGDAV